VAGQAGAGKSLLVAGDFAARVSTGSPWPDGSPCPLGDVLIASGEDGAADTLVPRLVSHPWLQGRRDLPTGRPQAALILAARRRPRNAPVSDADELDVDNQVSPES
jgi:hypothetical protein